MNINYNYEEIAFIMEMQDKMDSCYLDIQTGEIISIPEDIIWKLEDENAEELLNDEMLPDWEKKLIPKAEEILYGDSDRYYEIPTIPSYELYNLRVEFARNIRNDEIREKLLYALQGKGAFRRFKDVIREYPQIEKEWYEFEHNYLISQAKEWVESITKNI